MRLSAAWLASPQEATGPRIDGRVRRSMSRNALGNTDEVRVAVRVAGTRTDGTRAGPVGWLGQRRSVARWVAQD